MATSTIHDLFSIVMFNYQRLYIYSNLSFTGLVWGKVYRNPLFFMGKTMVSGEDFPNKTNPLNHILAVPNSPEPDLCAEVHLHQQMGHLRAESDAWRCLWGKSTTKNRCQWGYGKIIQESWALLLGCLKMGDWLPFHSHFNGENDVGGTLFSVKLNGVIRVMDNWGHSWGDTIGDTANFIGFWYHLNRWILPVMEDVPILGGLYHPVIKHGNGTCPSYRWFSHQILHL